MSVCIEGKRIDTKLAAGGFTDDEETQRRINASIGSERLRHALLTCMGIDPGPFMFPHIERPVIVVPQPKANEPRSPVGDIQKAVADYYELPVLLMKSSQRGRKIAHPRQVAMYLASQLTTFSLVQIGKLFGGRDHTTVLHAIRAVANRMDADPDVATDVESLREALGG